MFNEKRVFAVGFAALSVGAIAGAATILFPPETSPLLLTLLFATGFAVWGAVLDRMTPSGATC